MRAFVAGLGVLLGSLAALAGVLAALMFAWGVWHGGVLKGVHWTVHPNHLLAVVLFLIGWEIIGTICYLIVSLPFIGLSMLFPEPRAPRHA